MGQYRSGARVRSTPGDDDPVDSCFDIPAAVVCAICGQADCPGCLNGTDLESGVIAIIPWERPGKLWSRLWDTGLATTRGAEAFFTVLPDGEIVPALHFAILAEFLAVTSMGFVLVPILALALPSIAAEIVANPALRIAALRWTLPLVPILSAWMVAAHVAHGTALDVGARRNGGKPQRRRAIRFGLYACGWDLMSGPFGAIVALATKGKGRFDILSAALRVPNLAAESFLQGVYQLPAEQAASAKTIATAAAVLIALLTGTVVATVVAVGVLG